MWPLQPKSLQPLKAKRLLFIGKLFCLALLLHMIIVACIVLQGPVKKSLVIDTRSSNSSTPLMLINLEAPIVSSKITPQSSVTPSVRAEPSVIEKKVTAKLAPAATAPQLPAATPELTVIDLPAVTPLKKDAIATPSINKAPVVKPVVSTPIEKPKKSSEKIVVNKQPVSVTKQKITPLVPIGSPSAGTTHTTKTNNSIEHLVITLQKGIALHWQRPEGFDPKLYCILLVEIDMNGNKRITIQKSSGALMYDASAQSAVMIYKFPVWATNRSITLLM